MILEQILRTDCDRCGREAEHYVIDYGNRPLLCRCVKCGRVKILAGRPLNQDKPISR